MRSLFRRARTTPTDQDLEFMRQALSEAVEAQRKGEVPVGAVIVRDGRVISRTHNLTRTLPDPSAHAEMVAIRETARALRNERLTGCELFVTLEPCAMCAGAIVQARITRLVWGAPDPKAGACGSVLRVIPNKKLNHRPAVVKMVLASESASLLKSFFQARRGLSSSGL